MQGNAPTVYDRAQRFPGVTQRPLLPRQRMMLPTTHLAADSKKMLISREKFSRETLKQFVFLLRQNDVWLHVAEVAAKHYRQTDCAQRQRVRRTYDLSPDW
jgi:hypothetical protein